MAYDYSEIMQAQRLRLEADQAQAVADLEAARHADDPEGCNIAADRILKIDQSMNALAVRAQQFYAAQNAQPQGNKFGLSPDEVDISHGIAPGDRHLTDEQREELYARNKYKLQNMRAAGAYRDDQGTVRR